MRLRTFRKLLLPQSIVVRIVLKVIDLEISDCSISWVTRKSYGLCCITFKQNLKIFLFTSVLCCLFSVIDPFPEEGVGESLSEAYLEPS